MSYPLGRPGKPASLPEPPGAGSDRDLRRGRVLPPRAAAPEPDAGPQCDGRGRDLSNRLFRLRALDPDPLRLHARRRIAELCREPPRGRSMELRVRRNGRGTHPLRRRGARLVQCRSRRRVYARGAGPAARHVAAAAEHLVSMGVRVGADQGKPLPDLYDLDELSIHDDRTADPLQRVRPAIRQARTGRAVARHARSRMVEPARPRDRADGRRRRLLLPRRTHRRAAAALAQAADHLRLRSVGFLPDDRRHPASDGVPGEVLGNRAAAQLQSSV